VLAGAKVLAEESVAQHLEQFAVHLQPRASERQFHTDPLPQRGEGNVAFSGQAPHRVLIGEGGQDIRGDCRPDHLAVERE
jgi:hypothetical protein